MPDYSKCMGNTDTGELCPKRDTCLRYTEKPLPEPGWQMWFINSPYFNNNCEMYMEKE